MTSQRSLEIVIDAREIGQLEVGLEALSEAVVAAKFHLLTNWAIDVEAGAKMRAPVDTGRLRSSLTREVTMGAEESSAAVGTNVFYGPYQEFGTKPHMPPSAPIEAWAQRHGLDSAIAAKIRWAIFQRGTKPHPYLIPAFEETNRSTLPILLGELEQELEGAFMGRGGAT